jgi:hypothetical protein
VVLVRAGALEPLLQLLVAAEQVVIGHAAFFEPQLRVCDARQRPRTPSSGSTLAFTTWTSARPPFRSTACVRRSPTRPLACGHGCEGQPRHCPPRAPISRRWVRVWRASSTQTRHGKAYAPSRRSVRRTSAASGREPRPRRRAPRGAGAAPQRRLNQSHPRSAGRWRCRARLGPGRRTRESRWVRCRACSRSLRRGAGPPRRSLRRRRRG